MAELVLIQNESEVRRYTVVDSEMIIGRSSDAAVMIDDGEVSRRHARLWKQGERYYLEDLGSNNGTFVNTRRIGEKIALAPNDLIAIGPHRLRFRDESIPENELTIMRQTAAAATNAEIFKEDSAGKLRAVLELSHHLARALDTDTVLSRLLDQLLVLFKHADRAQAIFPEASGCRVRASRSRGGDDCRGRGFSRSLVKKVVEERVAVLAEDTRQLDSNLTIVGLGIHSLLAVPMQTRGGRVLGVIELDRYQSPRPFNAEDLHLLTAVVLQASSALENAALHEELLVKERMDGEFSLAREIQEGFLPSELPSFTAGAVDLFGDLQPAQEIAGDFYDYLALDERQLAFFVADVSGKGMPAALFMATVRSLLREALQSLRSPARILARLNDAISRNNPKLMFVTVLLGVYDTATGNVLLARAGHPPAVLRRRDGSVAEIESPQGRLIGIESAGDCFAEVTVRLEPGDALLLYTDGVTEAPAAEGANLFGVERLLGSVERLPDLGSLREWAETIRQKVETHSAGQQLPDDLTLLLLRRPG
jgi:phosphoserine phosphatase RsbU/P